MSTVSLALFHGDQHASIAGEQLSLKEADLLFESIRVADIVGFDEYPTSGTYLPHLQEAGLVAAVYHRGETPDQFIIEAKADLIVAGMGSLAVAKYEACLPVGVGHQEGFYTPKAYEGKGHQQALIGVTEGLGGLMGLDTFTVALAPDQHGATSMRNFARRGYLPGIVFDPEYLELPHTEERAGCFVGVKISDEPLPWTDASSEVMVVQQDADQEDFSAIQDALEDGYVCAGVDYVRNPDGTRTRTNNLLFVKESSFPNETRNLIQQMQSKIGGRQH